LFARTLRLAAMIDRWCTTCRWRTRAPAKCSNLAGIARIAPPGGADGGLVGKLDCGRRSGWKSDWRRIRPDIRGAREIFSTAPEVGGILPDWSRPVTLLVKGH
jgi:hypothetical protein